MGRVELRSIIGSRTFCPSPRLRQTSTPRVNGQTSVSSISRISSLRVRIPAYTPAPIATTLSVSPSTTGSLPSNSVRKRFTTPSLEEPPTITRSVRLDTCAPASFKRCRNNFLIFAKSGMQISKRISSVSSTLYSFPQTSTLISTSSSCKSLHFAASAQEIRAAYSETDRQIPALSVFSGSSPFPSGRSFNISPFSLQKYLAISRSISSPPR